MRHAFRFTACLLPLLPLLSSPAHAGEERQLAAAINAYRAHPSGCAASAFRPLPPLTVRSSLALPLGFSGGLREGLRDAGYQAQTVRSIRLVGARDADEAFDMLRERYCGALLDPQYADLGVTRTGGEWRLVLARSMGGGQLQDPRAAGKALLAEVNAARARPRLCGQRRFAAARPLSWSPALGAAAQAHSRDMARSNYFAHQDPDGDGPYDRARAAGYRGRQIGENIAAGQASVSQAMAGWLASPGHCANLMNPMFTQVGAAYASAARSDEGVYWTMLFGAP
ncbi:CAP domain-containing protein [Pseudomonas citronellolis]|uniref:CAP domain-containing protein n=1 Tax=Pseudomonas citronellolis TaxID=53408 RepID=UPI0023E45DD6|nr:CAP domain-containing protein [Pseudomonas citronellolis]MDF3934795.1 CAP domain-containing protein [Pseudomonas citronellolis]